MIKITHYKALTDKFEKIGYLNNLLRIIHWDYAVNLPKKSATNRQKEITTLSSMVHDMLTSQQTADLISKAEQEFALLDEWQQANIREIKRQFLHASCISPELQARHTENVAACEFLWRDARRDDNFAAFAPCLQQVVDLTKEIAAIKSEYFGLSAYDVLIDEYEPDRTSAEIKSIYNVLKQRIPKLLEQALIKQQQEKTLPINIAMSIAEQKILGKKIMQNMGFDFDRGRLDESAHPFCGGATNDVRLTTRYDENNFLSGLLGVIHETGHALYELNLPDAYHNQPVGGAKGMAFHESQSLIMECQVAKSKEFTEFLARILHDEFNLRGKEYESANLYKLLTWVEPSLIRVDADEVTYPLHVIIRFEIEEALISGAIKVNDLPKIWNEKMTQYLAVTPTTDRDGCLQDIHWSCGAFGYFPSYTNGAMIAAMTMNHGQATYPNIMQDIGCGDFNQLNLFLTKNLRQFGCSKTSTDLLYQATGHHHIKPELFIEYLTNKYC